VRPALLEDNRRDVPVAVIQKPTEGQRIAALPVADYFDREVVAYALAWARERWWRGPFTSMQLAAAERSGAKLMDFREVQAVALLVAAIEGGAFGNISVGGGKTLFSLLVGDALGAANPLLLHPASMRRALHMARYEYGASFKLPRNLRTAAYEELSTAKNTDLLDRLQPDCLVMDEAHKLANPEAARTKRVIRYLEAHPGVRVVVMSGTLTDTDPEDYAHLLRWSLKDRAPIPRDKHTLLSFSNILAVHPVKASSEDGETVYAAVREPINADWQAFSPIWPGWEDCDKAERQQEARRVWGRRLNTSPGVIYTPDQGVRASLVFRRRPVETPRAVLDALKKLEATWCREDGEELRDAKDVARVAQELAQGFFYRWVWPKDAEGKDVVDVEWRDARARWHKAVRVICKRALVHLDSPLLVHQALVTGRLARTLPFPEEVEEAAEAWAEWEPQSTKRWKGQPTPPTETVWLDTFLVDDAVAWLHQHPKGIVWYRHRAIAEALAERRVPVFGGGTNPQEVRGAYGFAASIDAHGTGKNLQYGHHENLCMSFPKAGKTCEQLIGRTHRQGQTADCVLFDYYAHVGPAKDAIEEARSRATYIQSTMNTPQRLCYGTWED
jgi:hypothetical protein